MEIHRDGLFEIVEMKMKAKRKLRVDDLVRVIQSGGSLGPTLYQVEFIGERGYCVIREAGKPLAGGQEFDTSLLQMVPR
jgi:hypothetical protein